MRLLLKLIAAPVVLALTLFVWICSALLYCYYKQWGVKKKTGQGHKPVIPLRFSKSKDPEIEKWYATHFVDLKRTAQLKAEAAKPKEQNTEVTEQS